MKFLLHIFLLASVLLICGATSGYAQIDPFNRDKQREEEAKMIKEMLAKQQSEREKKEHEELLKRADTAQELSDELEKVLEEHENLSSADEKKLVELEKVVKKIRDDLGGDDDEGDPAIAAKDSKPKNFREAFQALRKSTLELVDEVKKTTRYSISAAAIQSSNTVLRLVKFLRFRN